MKNKVKVLIIIIVLLLVTLGIYLFLNKENKYQNVRIISDNPSVGIPSKIICNHREYFISNESDIYSIKYYNGKLYYYKDIEGLSSYGQSVPEISDMNNIYYEFGIISLNENASTYSMNLIKRISHAEYNEYCEKHETNWNYVDIMYCVENSDGHYNLEIIESD